MKPEIHCQAFEERKETIFRWAIEVRGLENSQRIIGDNASKAVVELLSAYLHKEKKVEEGFQLNHTWFKSDKITERLPEFDRKQLIVPKMIELEKLCEKLSYGTPKPVEKLKQAIEIFREIEMNLTSMLNNHGIA